MRVERIILKHHGDVAFLRWNPVDDAVADADFTGRDVLEAGNHAQQGGFAAARRADQHDEFAVTDGYIDAVDYGGRAESLVYAADGDRSHSCPPGSKRRCVAFFRIFGLRTTGNQAHNWPAVWPDFPERSLKRHADPACPHSAGTALHHDDYRLVADLAEKTAPVSVLVIRCRGDRGTKSLDFYYFTPKADTAKAGLRQAC
jgi:hypothetical protein